MLSISLIDIRETLTQQGSQDVSDNLIQGNRSGNWLRSAFRLCCGGEVNSAEVEQRRDNGNERPN